MNSYISLQTGLGIIAYENDDTISLEDGFLLSSEDYVLGDYTTPHNKWQETDYHQATVRPTIDGKSYATFGYYNAKEWMGELRCRTDELEKLLQLLTYSGTIELTDHFGDNYIVASVGDVARNYLSPVWDSLENVVFVKTRFMEVKE